ncbi:MAG: Immunoglobulin I-set domain protein, partial [Pedosphaera sp.]|nr:Immunoglobulin I-set domain protein [Pedosphaera sp.]
TLTYLNVPATINSGLLSQYGNFEGNYAVFKGLTNDSFLVESAEFNSRSPINAIQIVPRATALPADIDPLFPATVYAGGRAVFRASVAGQAPFTYQWQKNGTNLTDVGNISGSLTAILVVSNVSLADAAPYNVIVSNAVGAISSSVATLTVTTPTPGSYAEKVFTNGAVAYWRLNEQGDPSTNYTAALDYVGGFTGSYQFRAQNGFNGIVGPQPGAGYPGFENGNTAMFCGGTGFSGANTSPHSWMSGPPLQLATNTVTFTAWIYPTSFAEPGSAGIIWSRNGNDTGGLDYQNNNHLGYTWNNQSGTYNFGAGPVVPSNVWSFVAAVITPTDATLYCYNTNGQFSATNTFTNAPMAFNGFTFIGDDPASVGGNGAGPGLRAFIGSIDEAAVFKTALSPLEINNMYKKGLGLTAIKPVIGTQPQSEALYAGRTASFAVMASGDVPLSYQWRTNGVNLAVGGNVTNVTSSALVITNVTAANAANYDVVVVNLAGSITSSVATLTVVAPPTTLSAYEAKLQAANPTHYWRFSEAAGSLVADDYWGGDIATNNNAQAGSAGPVPPDYAGFESTNTANSYDGLTAGTDTGLVGLYNNVKQFAIVGWFNTPGTEPVRTGLFGQNDVMEFGFHGVDASGEAQLGIYTANGGSAFLPQTLITPNQWYMVCATGDGTNTSLFLLSTNGGGGFQVAQTITPGATTTYGSSTCPIKIAADGVLDPTGNYFDGLIDEVATFNRALTVGELSDLFGAAIGVTSLAPQITIQPAPATETLYTGRTAAYSVTAVGSAPIAYHWRKNGTPISDGGNVSGTSTAALTITNVGVADAVSYDVVISNPAGSVTSSVVSFSVISPAPGGYESAAIALNPIAYYRLNETNDPSTGTLVANDYWGGHSGVYSNAVLNEFDGVLGPVPPAYTFETNNGAIQVSAIPSSLVTAPFGSLSTNTVTMTMWIKPAGTFDQFAGLLMNRNSGVAGGFGFAGTGPAGQLGYTWNNNNANTYNFNSGIFPPTNEWSFVALVVQPTQGILYMFNAEGVSVATNVVAHTPDVFGNNWQIGRDNSANANDGTRNFNGLIDEVAVYGYSLTQAQLSSLFAAGGGTVPFNLHLGISGSSVVLTWPQGTLQEAPTVSGPWTTNSATSPFTNTASGTKFYRVKIK